jgi:hypothetical protein
MKLHFATLTLGGLAIKLIILIEIVGPILISLMEKLEVPTKGIYVSNQKNIVLFF